MSFRADKVILYKEDQQLNRVHAFGEPAHFVRTESTSGQIRIESHARQIKYDASRQRLILLGDAFLSQEGNQFRGERIEYDIRNDTVRAQNMLSYQSLQTSDSQVNDE